MKFQLSIQNGLLLKLTAIHYKNLLLDLVSAAFLTLKLLSMENLLEISSVPEKKKYLFGKNPMTNFPLCAILFSQILQKSPRKNREKGFDCLMKTPQDVRAIVQALKELYPDGICSLQYQKDYELLFATRLSAQCTDERVNQVTPALFAQFPTLEALAAAEPEDLEPYIHSCGFFRAKARDIVFASRMLLEKYHGKVPGTMEELLSLPGVGRKTANLILGDVHRTPGVVVADTHCIRITGLLGLTDGTKDPGKVEKQLRACLPPEESNDFCHRLVLHGRAVCRARKPDCPNCTLRPWCDHFQNSKEG